MFNPLSRLRNFVLILLVAVPVFGLAQGTHVWRVNARPALTTDFVLAMASDAIGNTYLIGVDYDASPSSSLIKLSPAGVPLWTFAEPYLNLKAVAVGPDGSIYVGGSTSTDGFHAFIKLSTSDGSVIWRKAGSVFNESVQSLAVAQDGSSAFVAGQLLSGSPHYTYHFINPDGTERAFVTPSTLYTSYGAEIDARGMFYDAGATTPNDGYLFRGDETSSHLFSFPLHPIPAFAPDNLGSCYSVSSALTKTSDDAVLWTTSEIDKYYQDVVATVSGKAITCGIDESDHGQNKALISRFSADGTLELTNSFDAYIQYHRVLCDPHDNAFTLTERANGNTVDVFLRKLSASSFSPMWVGNSPGGAEKVNYRLYNVRQFVRSANGDLFTAGTGPSGEMFVDKFSDRTLEALTITPNPVRGSRNAVGRVTLSGPAVTDTPVTMHSSSPHVIFPNPVTVPAGQMSTTFAIWATDPTTPFVDATVKATALGDSKAVVLRVLHANSAKFVSCTLPATMVGGTSFHVKMRFVNSGELTWDTAHHYELRSISPVDNFRWHVNRMELTNGPVGHGAVGVFAATVRAPLVSGTYSFKWEPIAGDAHGPFGASGGPSVVVTSPLHPSTPPVSTRRRHRRGH